MLALSQLASLLLNGLPKAAHQLLEVGCLGLYSADLGLAAGAREATRLSLAGSQLLS